MLKLHFSFYLYCLIDIPVFPRMIWKKHQQTVSVLQCDVIFVAFFMFLNVLQHYVHSIFISLSFPKFYFFITEKNLFLNFLFDLFCFINKIRIIILILSWVPPSLPSFLPLSSFFFLKCLFWKGPVKMFYLSFLVFLYYGILVPRTIISLFFIFFYF